MILKCEDTTKGHDVKMPNTIGTYVSGISANRILKAEFKSLAKMVIRLTFKFEDVVENALDDVASQNGSITIALEN